MKSIKRIFFLLSFISVSYLSTFAQENQSYFLHTIEKGQSLYSISSMYGVSKADIIRLNPGCEDKIYAGQAIKIPQNKTAQKGETFHTIQPGETLYRLTTTYKVSAKAICDANPGLSAENFRIGQVIRIPSAAEAIDSTVEAVVAAPSEPAMQPAVKPRCKDMHKVKRRETIFSVSREYGISEQELIAANPELKNGMKKGQFLCIPYPSEKPTVTVPKTDANIIPPSDSELFRENKEVPKSISTIKAALLLPFDDKRMVEYYEGFLMAVDSLKRTGTSIDLYVYDCNKESSSLNSILAKSEMKNMNVIFGPAQQQHIKPLAAFAKKNDIRLVIPFSSKEGEVFNNPFIYQINTPQSYLYSEVYEHFTRQFPNANVILLESAVVDKDKVEFIKGLKQELGSKGIPVKTLKENAPVETLKAALHNDKENFFIPTSGNDLTLLRIIPQLTLLVRDNPEARIHLFGYPEWQTYTKEYLNNFHKLNTVIFTRFYTNPTDYDWKEFQKKFYFWYNKDMINANPKYGLLGFDTGMYFLSVLKQYGKNFENHLNQVESSSIQTDFKFQRINNWSGFINKSFYFVYFKPSYIIEKRVIR